MGEQEFFAEERNLKNMETRDFIQAQFDFLHNALVKITDGLSLEELAWRPGAANPIAFLMLHIARSEDINVTTRLQGKPQVWVSGGWHKKYGLAADETTFGWTDEKLGAFKYPALKDMLAYADAVRSLIKGPKAAGKVRFQPERQRIGTRRKPLLPGRHPYRQTFCPNYHTYLRPHRRNVLHTRT